MSQQSTMKTVVPYFGRWMEKLPTIEALAEADIDDVMKLWAGLGYYSRARNVHATAKQLVLWRKNHGSQWPTRASEWQSFKGIGPYTAAAVASIAFGDPVVPVDGNVLRVGARFFGLPDPLNNGVDRKTLERHFAQSVRQVAAKDVPIFGQSLMELGALVCRPGAQALCELCPIRPGCVAYGEGKVAEWPLAKKRPQVEEKHLMAEIFWDGGDQMLFRKIPKGERLEGQWELPLTEVSPEKIDEIQSNYGVLGPVNHSITRYRFKVWAVLRGAPQGRPQQGQALSEWREPRLHLTTLTLKLLSKLDSLLN
jgi:A/G-specific adenine glycosylase